MPNPIIIRRVVLPGNAPSEEPAEDPPPDPGTESGGDEAPPSE